MLPRVLLILAILCLCGCLATTPNRPPPVEYVQPSTK